MARSSPDKSLPDLVSELWELVVAYFKQETVEPIRTLGRFVVLGVAGSVLLSIGFVLVALALLRALQTETGTTFTGNWSWAPYLLTLLFSALIAALAVRAVGAAARRGRAGA